MHPQPSSLVFVAIIAAWAAYLVPQWVRRRDLLAASRGRDRYSGRLRVLSRRRRGIAGPSSTALLTPPAGQPGPDTADPARRSVVMAGSTAAPGRPQPTTRPVAAPAEATDAPVSPPAGPAGPGPVRDRVAARSDVTGSGARMARRRLVVLAILVTSAAVSSSAAAIGRLAWVVATPSWVLLAADLIALRVTAVSRRRIASRVPRSAPGRRQASVRRPGPAAAAGPRPAVRPGLAQAAAAVRTRAAHPEVRARSAVATSPLAADGTWTPIPVPPPTYTLKETAPRPAPRPLPDDPAAGSSSVALHSPLPVRPWAVPPEQPPSGSRAEPRGSWRERGGGEAGDPAGGEYSEEVDLDVVLARRRVVNA